MSVLGGREKMYGHHDRRIANGGIQTDFRSRKNQTEGRFKQKSRIIIRGEKKCHLLI